MRTPFQLLHRNPTGDLPGGAAHGGLHVWGGRALVTVADPAALAAALRLAHAHLRSVARACDRHDPAAEVHRLPAADGAPVPVGPLLLRHVRAALETAAATGGLVDPTVVVPRSGGGPGVLPVCQRAPRARPAPGWRSVRVTDRTVRVPGGTALDLTASALPLALDDVALVVARLTGSAVRLSLNGCTASCDASGRTAGGAAVDACWVVDPRTGRPAAGRWSRVQVRAESARTSSALAVAAVLRDDDAPRWLADRAASARLVGADGDVVVGDPLARDALAA
jgi:thiamine biosynthesis lipoprotein